jgi:hypothetical protein
MSDTASRGRYETVGTNAGCLTPILVYWEQRRHPPTTNRLRLQSKRNRQVGVSGSAFLTPPVVKYLNTLGGGGGRPRKRAEDRGRTTRTSVCHPPFRERRAPFLIFPRHGFLRNDKLPLAKIRQMV